MDLDRFERELPTLFDGDPNVAAHPKSRRFANVVEDTEGMATENGLALLDLAVKCLEGDEVYLEIGTYRGTSAIAAAMDNPHARIVAIDNFSQFGGPEEECRANLKRFGCENVELIVRDAWEYLESEDTLPPVGVYFYDGGHTFEDQYRALESIEPYLAERALVLVDDATWPEVRAANRLYAAKADGYDLLAYYRGTRRMQGEWWNGVVLYRYERPKSDRSVPARGLAYRLKSTLYGPRALVFRSRIVGGIRTVGSKAKRRLIGKTPP